MRYLLFFPMFWIVVNGVVLNSNYAATRFGSSLKKYLDKYDTPLALISVIIMIGSYLAYIISQFQ